MFLTMLLQKISTQGDAAVIQKIEQAPTIKIERYCKVLTPPPPQIYINFLKECNTKEYPPTPVNATKPYIMPVQCSASLLESFLLSKMDKTTQKKCASCEVVFYFPSHLSPKILKQRNKFCLRVRLTRTSPPSFNLNLFP